MSSGVLAVIGRQLPRHCVSGRLSDREYSSLTPLTGWFSPGCSHLLWTTGWNRLWTSVAEAAVAGRQVGLVKYSPTCGTCAIQSSSGQRIAGFDAFAFGIGCAATAPQTFNASTIA